MRLPEWVKAGPYSISPDFYQMVERLLQEGVIQIDGVILELPLGVCCPTRCREDFALFLQNVLIASKPTSAPYPGEGVEEPIAQTSSYRPLLEDPMRGLSLSDIYRHIPSPPRNEATQPDGVMTPLFTYQKRTLHRMLERESQPTLIPGQNFIPLLLDDGHALYLHPTTLEIKTSLPASTLVPDARGGVLSEEMGVGKTLECLTLILSTRGQLPLADTDEMASAVTSTLAIQWPHPDLHGLDPIPKESLELERIPYYSAEILKQSHLHWNSLRQQQETPFGKPEPAETTILPSLTHLCAHVLRMSGQPIAPEQYENEDMRICVSAMQPLLKRATPFYHLWPPLRGHRTPRVEVRRTPVKIYLSTATLVVVPGTLLAQWQAEIEKHVSPGALRVLYLSNASSKIPSPVDLANEYDLILLSHSRLGKEDKEGSLEWKWPGVPRECRCPYIGSSRFVDCKCPLVRIHNPSDIMSPLLQCNFKRLCIDEGHVAAGESDMVRMATKIRAECRWVISGTPTTSLVGSDLYRGPSLRGARNGVMSRTECNDLEKLRSLLADFLRVPHLHEWHSQYETPYKRGSIYASSRLWNLFRRVMVRNQPQDVEDSSPLPPMQETVLRLHFTRVERATFNVLQGLILLNAIWSQREDDDYFFHQSNRKHLSNIMENLSLSCFHFAGSDLAEQAKEALLHAQKQLAKIDKWNAVDRKQAQAASHHLEIALSDEMWTKRSSDVAFRTAGLDEEIKRSWTRQGGSRGLIQLSAEELSAIQRAMRSILMKQASATFESSDLARHEEIITMGKKDRRAFFERQSKTEHNKKDRSQNNSAPVPALSVSPSKVKPSSTRRRREEQSKKLLKLSLLEYTIREYRDRKALPEDSRLQAACLVGSSSTKLATLLNVLSQIPSDEKVVIFSNLDNVLYEVSTALDISSQPHFIYASGSSQERRNEVISAFRSEQTLIRVLLMKVNIGGRGLDLSCANHVIFLEPILDKGLRVQALKRTWRIGQKRPVQATTLVMRETFEEDVLRIGETAITQKLSEEPSMRAVVSNPTFVSEEDNDIECLLNPAINLFVGPVGHSKIATMALPTPPVSPEIWRERGDHLGPLTSLNDQANNRALPSVMSPTAPLETQRQARKQPRDAFLDRSTSPDSPLKKKRKQVSFA